MGKGGNLELSSGDLEIILTMDLKESYWAEIKAQHLSENPTL